MCKICESANPIAIRRRTSVARGSDQLRRPLVATYRGQQGGTAARARGATNRLRDFVVRVLLQARIRPRPAFAATSGQVTRSVLTDARDERSGDLHDVAWVDQYRVAMIAGRADDLVVLEQRPVDDHRRESAVAERGDR